MEAVESKNYYELLGLSRTATTDEVKAAYRDIARVFHPDSNFFGEILDGQNITIPETQNKTFKLVTSAYNTLVNEAKRKAYDAALPREFQKWEGDEAEVRESQVKWENYEDSPEYQRYRKRRDTGSYAMGKFGVVPAEAPNQLSEAYNPRTSSVQHMIRAAQRDTFKHYLVLGGMSLGGFVLLVIMGLAAF